MRILTLISLISLIMIPAAAAQTPSRTSPERLSDVYACAEVRDTSLRLACYDTAVTNLRQAEAEGEIVAVDRQQAETLQRESFGFSLPSLSGLMPRLGAEERNEQQMQIARVVRGRGGFHRFEMTDGQTWTQTELQSVGNVRVGDTIVVRQGILGSYLMSSPRGGAPHRVRRTG